MIRQFKRLVCLLALLAFLAALPAHAQGVMMAPGDKVPDLRGFDLDQTLQVVDFEQAEFTLINFWATWCQPCKEEMPMLQAAHETYGADSLQVIGVTSENLSNAELAEFVAAMGLTYTVFRMGPESQRSWPGVRGTLPNSFLVRKDGSLVRRYVGANAEQIVGMKTDIEALIAGRSLGTMVKPTAESVATGSPDKAPK